MDIGSHTSPSTTLPAELAGKLAKSLRDLRFGTLEIKIHDGKVMEIVEHRRVRFTGAPERPAAPEM